MKIFVAKLNFKTQTSQLQQLFEEYGTVTSCKIVTDRETNKSKGFGFVEMPNDDEAGNAISALNDTDFDGRTIVVQESKEDNRGGGNRGGGNRGGGGNYRGGNDRGFRDKKRY